MGYRSAVRIITSKKGFKELRKFSDNYLKEKKCGYGNILDELDVHYENKYQVYFGWNAVKWYEDCDYFQVDAIMEGLSHLEDKDYSYRYSRIGENYDDIEEQYYESNREEEQDLEYPSIIRDFEDDYTERSLEEQEEGYNKEEISV